MLIPNESDTTNTYVVAVRSGDSSRAISPEILRQIEVSVCEYFGNRGILIVPGRLEGFGGAVGPPEWYFFIQQNFDFILPVATYLLGRYQNYKQKTIVRRSRAIVARISGGSASVNILISWRGNINDDSTSEANAGALADHASMCMQVDGLLGSLADTFPQFHFSTTVVFGSGLSPVFHADVRAPEKMVFSHIKFVESFTRSKGRRRRRSRVGTRTRKGLLALVREWAPIRSEEALYFLTRAPKN